MIKTTDSIHTKLNVRIHRINGKIQSSIMSFGINKGYFVSVGIGLLSVAKIIAEGYMDGWSTFNYDISTLWPIVLTILTTLATTINAIYNYRNYSNTYSIIQDDFYKKKVINSMVLSEKQLANGYNIESFNNGTSVEKYVMSDDINIDLINGKTINVFNLGYKFQLADEIKNFVPSILKRNFLSNKLIFNGKLVRMANDIYKDVDSVNVQEVRYFDGQCTNEIVYKQIKSNCSLDSRFLGESLLLDKDNVLYDLEYSSCANYIGASTIAVTKDNYLIIGKQGDYSRANAGRYAPSGSGSVNYNDLKLSKDFNSLIIKAMEREFCEENYYKFINKINTIVIGYARLIERGGKPDFFGISFVDDYSYNFSNKIKYSEYGLVDNSEIIPVDCNLGIGNTLLKFCTDNADERKISIQLMILAQIISKHEKSILDKLNIHLNR